MYALFDDAGKFHAGRLMSEAESSVQVELDSGKRVKVKAANVMLRFEKPTPAELMTQAAAIATEIDLDLAWEFAPEDEFAFGDLAREYFDAKAGPEQQAAALFRLFDSPHYFRRMGKGQFKKAPEETVKAALLGIERKKLLAAQIEAWAVELAAGTCPAPVREQLYRILFKPDKNGPEYKAVVEASKRAQRAPLDLLTAAGAIESPYQFHWQRFLFEQFPKGYKFGTAVPALAAPAIKEELPLAPVQAFSIDDSATTEIDDALSVQGLGTGTIVFGVHIAAPGLAIAPDSPIDKVARDRLSTVYMPGWKITMLPDDVVQAYTLAEGRDCPAVSLYVTMDEATLEVRSSETKLERVPIAANLRHDKLDAYVTEASLNGTAPADYAFAAELAFAFRLANTLKARREVVRGKPENFNRPDYNFKLVGNEAEPLGNEQVQITTRQRGSAGPDRGRGDDPGQQHLGWLAGRKRRARHLPQPGQPGARHQGAHGYQARTARRHGRGAVRLEHQPAAPLCGPGQPVADHCLRPPRPHRRTGRAFQAERRRAVRRDFQLRHRLCGLQRLPAGH
jgi:exoribonuclease-2